MPWQYLNLVPGVLGPITAWGNPIEGMGAGQEWCPRFACHLGGRGPGRVATILPLCYLRFLGKSLEALPDSPVSGGRAGGASGLLPSHLEARRGSPTQAAHWWELDRYSWHPFLTPRRCQGGGNSLETRGGGPSDATQHP